MGKPLKECITKFLASFFYTGYVPVAPGTAGTLAGVSLYYFLYPAGLKNYLFFTALFCISGIGICSQAEIVFGEKDSPKITIDEIAGFMITMVFIPFRLKYIILGFLFFRIMDIWKPFPVFSLQKLPGGFGVMADDIMAGLYSNLLLQIIRFYFSI